MGDRDSLQLVEGLGHADVENLFAPVAAGQDELHAQSRFAGARLAFDEVEAAEDEAAAEDVVQSRQPGRGPVAPIQRVLSPSTGSDAGTAKRHQSGRGFSYQETPGSRILFTDAAGRLPSQRTSHVDLVIQEFRSARGTSDCSYICSLTRRLKGTSGGATGVPASLVRLPRACRARRDPS